MPGVMLVTSDAHEGLRRAISETFQGAAWQRCAVHLVRDCVREAKTRQLRRRVARIVSPVFRAKGAEPDAPACLDFPQSHRKRLRTNNVQERTNREIKRRARVVQVFPSTKSLERLVGAVMCDQDEEWQASRCVSEGKTSGLYEEGTALRASSAPTHERLSGLQVLARKAIDASLEPADEMEAA